MSGPATARARRLRPYLAGGLCTLLSLLVALVVAGVWWWRSHDFAAVVERAGGRFSSYQGDSLFVNAMRYIFSRRMPETLHWVIFERTDVDADWLGAHREELSRLSHLSLILTDCPITDTHLSRLNGLQNIHALILRGTQVTDAALADVVSLNSLVDLDVANTRITDTGLEQLPQLAWLATISIDSAQATDTGVASLSTCTRLVHLRLVDARDDALARVAALHGLLALIVEGPDLTTASIPALAGMPNLKILTLIDSSLTEDDCTELQRALPGCTLQQFTLEQLKEMERALE